MIIFVMETETEMELATENGQKTWQLINEQAAPATPAQLVKNDAARRFSTPLFPLALFLIAMTNFCINYVLAGRSC